VSDNATTAKTVRIAGVEFDHEQIRQSWVNDTTPRNHWEFSLDYIASRIGPDRPSPRVRDDEAEVERLARGLHESAPVHVAWNFANESHKKILREHVTYILASINARATEPSEADIEARARAMHQDFFATEADGADDWSQTVHRDRFRRLARISYGLPAAAREGKASARQPRRAEHAEGREENPATRRTEMSDTNPDTMTLDQCRDELARMMPEQYRLDGDEWFDRHGGNCGTSHPIPPTLDAIVAAMPEGWRLEITVWNVDGATHGAIAEACPEKVCGTGHHEDDWETHKAATLRCHADTELLARARLAVKCRRAADAK